MRLELTDNQLSLKRVTEKDFSVLKEIYFSTRENELKRVPQWTAEMKLSFLTQQFNAQYEYYLKNYPGADFWLLKKNEIPIGRLYLHENFQDKGIRIIDIALLPAWQRKGIGKSILEDLIQKANELNRPLSIHVESFNPAKKLYERLGFKMISETNGVYHLMEIQPSASALATDAFGINETIKKNTL